MRGKLPARAALVAVHGSLVGNVADSSAFTIPDIPSATYQVVEEAVTNQFFERIHSYGF